MRFIHETPIEPMFKGDFERHPSTPEECKAWLNGLWSSPFQYHIDDNPRNVIERADGKPFVTELQAIHLEDCLEACTIALGSWEAVWEAYYKDEVSE